MVFIPPFVPVRFTCLFQADIEHYVAHGATTVIIKPLRTEMLKEALNEYF